MQKYTVYSLTFSWRQRYDVAVAVLLLLSVALGGCYDLSPSLIPGAVVVRTSPAFGSMAVVAALVNDLGSIDDMDIGGRSSCAGIRIRIDSWWAETIAHELTHVRQCRQLGGDLAFSILWYLASLNQSCDSPMPDTFPRWYRCNAYEIEAYAMGESFRGGRIEDVLEWDPFGGG